MATPLSPIIAEQADTVVAVVQLMISGGLIYMTVGFARSITRDIGRFFDDGADSGWTCESCGANSCNCER